MFILELYDRKGAKLKEGDIVKVSDGRFYQFYAEVKYLSEENAIAPFHTFSFISFEKVKSLPDNVVQSTETRYKIWYHPDKYEDEGSFDKYLLSWRDCEHHINHRCFRIKLLNQK